MVSPTEENYLKALFHLSHENGDVSVKDLSDQLSIKMPTATSMMKKLAEKGLVNYESYKPLKLTIRGLKEAGLIVRKHRLTEMFLVEKMGFSWEEVHEIAEQVEHVHSPLLFERMDKLLGYPTIDPHGSPIPDNEGNVEQPKYDKLSDCKAGDKFTLLAVATSSEEFLHYLNSHQLKLDTVIAVLAVEAFDASMTVSYGNKPQVTMGEVACKNLLGRRG